MRFKGTRTVYIRDPEKNYQFVPIGIATYAMSAKGDVDDIPLRIDLTEGPFKRVKYVYSLGQQLEEKE